MTSWRQHLPLSSQDELDRLLGASLDFAQRQLASAGEFFPFAAVVDAWGQIEMIAARPDINDDQPTSSEVIRACQIAVAERADTAHAAAVTADVKMPREGHDAIQVTLEHRDGVALTVLVPYQKKRFRSSVDYGELQAAEAKPSVWFTSPPT